MLPTFIRLVCLVALSSLALTGCPGSSSDGELGSGGSQGSGSHVWKGEGSNVFRDSQYDQGEWIYTNGLWQAQGANADTLHRTDYFAALIPLPIDPTFITRDVYNALTYDFFGAHRATHNGDYQLPQDTSRWPDGTGDLAELRLAADSRYLYVRLLWNSMPRPDAQIATLTFATAGANPPSLAWPRNAKLASRWQRALTLWGTGAVVQAADGTETSVQASAGDHVTEARIPLNLLPPAPWTLTGGSGLSDPAQTGRYWTVPIGLASQTTPGTNFITSPTNVWGLLFVQDTPWTFDERKQADHLAAGEVSADSATVELSALQNRATRPAPLRTGDLSRLFSSRIFISDGIHRDHTGALPIGPPADFAPPIPIPDFNVTYQYNGRLQTYSMHVPEAYKNSSADFPLIVYLHGYTGLPDEPFYNPVGLVPMADQKGYLFASALGRGDYFYRGEGDLDVLELIADVTSHYRVDLNRIYLMGHSMGGYGTNNMGAHHPDLFAAMAPAEGTDSQALHANLRNLPWFEMTADEDLDLLAQEANALYSLLSAAGYDATLIEYRLKTHEYSSIYDTLPRLFDFFGSHVRNPNPAVISYTRITSEDRTDLGLIYDGAYWLSGLRAVDETLPANVTLESDAIAHVVPNPAAATRTDQSVDEGGPSGRTLAQLKQTVPNTVPAAVIGNVLHITATNAALLSVDLARAKLTLGVAPLQLKTQLDAPLQLRLRTVSGSVRVSVDGATATTLQAANGLLIVPVPAGTHVLTLRAV